MRYAHLALSPLVLLFLNAAPLPAADSVPAAGATPRAAASPAAATPAKPKPKAAAKATPKPDPDAGLAVGENKATPVSRLTVAKGFKVELLYSVPFKEQGSWINLCVDDKGRILTSDQYGGLYRFTPPPPGEALDPAKIESVPAAIRGVNGMVWAFGALYVGVNDYESKIPGGLYRVTYSKGSDQLDTVELLREIDGHGDHAVHAVVPTPDGKALYLICGDGAKKTEVTPTSPVPPMYGEDHLLPRMPDGRGFMRDVLAPGGIIYRVSPDGKDFDLLANGFRNIFDAAVNREGELFTYDADMEYDFNTSWYRPTRICHVVSGAEFGWRNGAGKRPPFYPDNLPPVLDIGPGSPTGVTFGYGAKFPAKYQNALFGLDWSWGRLYAVHLQPAGATYTGTKEVFISGAPLPLTDAIIHPRDGAMYFTTGGRKVQSGVYRVTYVGSESTAPASARPVVTPEAKLRHELEAFHGPPNPKAVAFAWPHLGDKDRFIRWAARIAIQHQPYATWAEKALNEPIPAIQLEALLALTEAAGIDPQHRQPTDPPVDTETGTKILAALGRLSMASLSNEERIAVVRIYEIAFVRFGRPDAATIARVIARLDPQFPAATRELNWVLCETLVYLQAPDTAAKAMALIAKAPTQEEQIEYARSLRMLKTGWTKPLHTAYFEWFLKAANYHGGASFEKFIEFIHNDAVASLSEAEKAELAEVLARQPEKKSALAAAAEALAGHTTVTQWTLEELSAAAATGMHDRNFERGHNLFGAVGCFVCHRFGNEGGMTGPDLTGAGGRYSPHDLLDQIINPSKEINEQFVPTVLTKKDGEQIIGTIVNLNNDTVSVNTDPTEPNQQVRVDRKLVVSMEPSKISPMPVGLLNILSKEEILDLVAYVLSGGNAENEMFKK